MKYFFFIVIFFYVETLRLKILSTLYAHENKNIHESIMYVCKALKKIMIM